MARAGALSAAIAVLVLAGCGSSTSSSTSASAVAGAHTATTGVLRAAPAPLPAGTPAAPAGLARTGGYDTYELCRGACTGAVPASLRRPLHLPHARAAGCRISAAQPPVSISGGAPLSARPFVGSRWLAARVIWRVAVGYRGPILIRGRQLGGAGAVGFGEGHRPYDELQLLDSGRGDASAGGGGRTWLSLTRVRGPGCYAYQVDGTSFSRVIVFRVRG